MGPNTILDKSAFQALSYVEHGELTRYFEVNIAPVLVLEILGDLAKQRHDGKAPAEKVQELATKFGGLEWLNEGYRFICINTLLGTEIPLDGHIVPANASVVQDDDGSLAGLVEPGPLNEMLLRLASGKPTALDEALAKMWRRVASGLSLTALNSFVNQHHVVVPRVRSPAEAVEAARALVDTPALQEVWLSWLLDQLSVPTHLRSRIYRRWNGEGFLLRSFAPYAHHCFLSLLSMFVAWRHSVVSWKPTNLLDLQYLYYLPFCTVFVSDDKLHRALAPPLMRSDQSFVALREFKAGLRQASEYFVAMSESDRSSARQDLYDWPPLGSVVRELWLKNRRWVGPPPA